MFRGDLMEGTRILVTGGANGAARAVASRFLELGADLALCGADEAGLEEAAWDLSERYSGEIGTYACDTRQPEQVADMVAGIWEEQGPLDGLVNVPGPGLHRAARTETLSARAVDGVLDGLLHATTCVTLACGRRWIAERRPAAVLSLAAGDAGSGGGGGADQALPVPAAMGHAGVLAMTRSLAVEWGAYGLRFNAIAGAPGGDDAAPPMGLADLAVYLMAPGSGSVNGAVVALDGRGRLPDATPRPEEG